VHSREVSKAFEGEREQSKDRCAHGDHYGSNTLDPSIGKSTLQRFPFFVHFLDEIEEHDYVADDDTNQTRSRCQTLFMRQLLLETCRWRR
jgi:hypothetical protein